MSNADYLDNLNNLVYMAYAFKGQLYDKPFGGIMIEGDYPGEGYKILEPEKKEIVQ